MARAKMGTGLTVAIAVTLSAAAVGGVYGPDWMRELRWEKERAGYRTISILSSAEAAFRWSDADGNGIPDYWTGDVAELYQYGLIPREVAEADAAPLHPLVPTPIPYKGFYFKALVLDDATTPPKPYRKYTDLKSGAVHNLVQFGFVAYPAGGFRAAQYMWIVCETNTAMRSPIDIPVPVNFPTDQELMSHWSKVQ